mmetsp:Transcript_33254/g.80616  ORF Transcript_33254/g.80616 Transcript_33254/m.80616 type:complete len:82 (-) Transcript_33254:2-247(-)
MLANWLQNRGKDQASQSLLVSRTPDRVLYRFEEDQLLVERLFSTSTCVYNLLESCNNTMQEMSICTIVLSELHDLEKHLSV